MIEMLVSTAVFMTVMVVAAGSLVSIINENEKAQAIKSVIDNVTFAVDSISRNLKSGTQYSCIPTGQSSFAGDCAPGGHTIHYLNSDGAYAGLYTEYRFVDTATAAASGMGNIQRINGCDITGADCGTNSWQSLTAPTANVNISDMTFYVLGTTGTNQPRVIVTVDGIIHTNDGANTEFTLQTTASQRSRTE